MLDFSGESKKNKRFFIFFVKKEPFLSAPKGMGFPGLKFIMKHGAYSNSARCRINAIESNRNQIPFHNSTIYDAEVNINYDTGVAILTDNVVDEKSRGKGIGSLGMTYIKDFCKAEKCICIDGFKRPVPNTEEEMIKLTHFYIKNGFEQLQNNEIRYIIEN